MRIPERFLTAIDGDPGNCVLIVGAGLSKQGVRRSGRGIPDWDELMHLMVTHLRDASRCSGKKLDALESLLQETPPRYLDVAEEFWLAHMDDRDGYESFLRQHLKPDDLSKSDLHTTILGIGFWGIVSYNFDLVFEKQSDRLNRIVYPDLLQQIGQFQRRGFFAKMHGCISGPATSLVLTRTSYENLRRDPRYRDLVRTVLFGHKVLCAGFSLRDPDFQSILEDLKEHWGPDLPPLYALLRDPGEDERAQWRKSGMDILPYDEHADVRQFFLALERLSLPATPPTPRRRVTRAKKELVDVGVFLTEWEHAKTIEEMDEVLADRMLSLQSPVEQETLLFRLAALCQPGQAVHLCRQLVVLGTPSCLLLARRVFMAATEADSLGVMKPHQMNARVHRWVLEYQELRFSGEQGRRLYKWFLDENWGPLGIDLWATFLRLLAEIKAETYHHGLEELYDAAQHLPGATGEIEKLALPAHPHPGERRTSHYSVARAIQLERYKQTIHAKSLSPADKLAAAIALDTSSDFESCLEIAVESLLDEFVQRVHLTLHGSSGLYDPRAAQKIVDALAGLQEPHQMRVLWTINHWPERMRGLGSLMDDAENLRSGLLVPLWWRYGSKTRIEYLREHDRGLSPHPQWTGQEFLLETLMGLHYDIDQDFRATFNASLEQYRNTKGSGYEPRLLQELWRGRELTYRLSDDCPPELVRRVAVRRVDWENSTPGSVRWKEANERSQAVFSERQRLREYVCSERADYVIDNLLGAYFPSKREVVLYTTMVKHAAAELNVEADALLTVVYIHETVHAFSHLGRDLSGRMWESFALPTADAPDTVPSSPHEGIAQFYTFKLLDWLGDERLVKAFLALEKSSAPVYRVWRETERYSLEKMREILVRYRSSGSAWPPDIT